ncbi:MAG: hypothetical protein HC840_22080, partial [Leptolyngbyaceae cyanobacterium RM2_2_4]|nr:hypothetical protein [Leptolyngbyaceae cyanobacterium RM2_2_4]
DYMVPAVWVALEALPLTPNGKVDRRSLPDPEPQRLQPLHRFVAPRSPVECQLTEIWKQVLRVEQVGIYDNFFELGGDSILSIQNCVAIASSWVAVHTQSICSSIKPLPN